MKLQRVLIVGAGAQAQAVADVLLFLAEQGKPVAPVGFVDDNPALAGRRFFDLPVFGGLETISRLPHDALIVGIGSNRARRQIYESLVLRGERFVSVVHPSAVLSRDVELGSGTYIGATAVVSVTSRIGNNVVLNGTACLGHHVTIGDHVHVAPGVTIAGGVRIGTGTMVGIGANILPRLCVGEGCMVGSGALVRHDVPNGATVVGVPARQRM